MQRMQSRSSNRDAVTASIFRSVLFALLILCSAARADDETLSRDHYQLGSDYYAQAHYREALREFQAGLGLSQRPAFLFNIARCYEKLEDWEKAAAAYESYLPTADATERQELNEHIASLHTHVAPSPPPGSSTTPAAPDLRAHSALSPRESLPTARTAAYLPRGHRRWWIWATTAGVVASIAIGVGVGIGLRQTPSESTLHPVTFSP